MSYHAKCPTCGVVKLVREAPAAFDHIASLQSTVASLTEERDAAIATAESIVKSNNLMDAWTENTALRTQLSVAREAFERINRVIYDAQTTGLWCDARGWHPNPERVKVDGAIEDIVTAALASLDILEEGK